MVISPGQAQLTDCSIRTLQSPTTRLSEDYRTYHHSTPLSSVFIGAEGHGETMVHSANKLHAQLNGMLGIYLQEKHSQQGLL